ncbi:hypothetical protein FSP39_020012 [Pinctada imbricata]|uniref:ZMYM2-like/QRICH1 C-terminal domain-containing protein n=1 Tax=Pinctada imbricata TaxID=66713 RepID=A0AA89BRK8_PINIB|nr:hypothetical protein FSP39_020012 [Pinctada imbricata]
MWFNNTIHFGIRGGGEEHRGLCVGDFSLGFDDELDAEFVEFNERQTKIRTGIDINNIHSKAPRMYASKDDRCPVDAFKKYTEKRPENKNNADDPFYLSVVTNNKRPSEDEQWFLAQPMGKHKLYHILKKMVEEANISSENLKHLTNTSAQKYLCQKLLDNNVPDTQAVHITGNRNPQSLNNYRTFSNKQQQSMSEIIRKPSNSVTAKSPLTGRAPAQAFSSFTQSMQSTESSTEYTSISILWRKHKRRKHYSPFSSTFWREINKNISNLYGMCDPKATRFVCSRCENLC